MEITDENLQKFRAWVIDRGRSEDTAKLYVLNIRSCHAHPDGITRRLVAGQLAPNTVRANLAALRAWALFSDDTQLAKRLGDLRLPPARRIRHKIPLDLDGWRTAIRHLQTCRMANEAMRCVLLLMAIRGFRSGDVLRMRREEIVRALDTGKLIYEGKGRKRMEFAIASFREPLEALAKMPGWKRVRDLITTSANSRVASTKVWRASRRTAAAVGILQMNPHRYRHTIATNYLAQLKGDPNAILKLQTYMGWESMNTAARYVDTIRKDELEDIGAALISGLLADPRGA